jgi:hypothetical protein
VRHTDFFERTKKPHGHCLLPLFLTGFVTAFDLGTPGFTLAIFALTALIYAALHLMRARWYVWSAALLSALCAYFAFFQLTPIARFEFPPVYQVLIASTLLVLPELFTGSQLSLKSETRWPPIAFGIFVSMLGITLALADVEHSGRGALALIVYAVLFTLHALKSKRTWLIYFATATETLAVVYALNYFDLDLWLPALTLLATLYYATGFFFRRQEEDIRAWGNVLINSGLTLGSLLSLVSLFSAKDTGGWYIIVLALLFAVEIFARPFLWLELAVEVLLSISLYLILGDFNVTYIGHFLFGASLIWLGGDLASSRLIQQKRICRPIPLWVGFILLFLCTFSLIGDCVTCTSYLFFPLRFVLCLLSPTCRRTTLWL